MVIFKQLIFNQIKFLYKFPKINKNILTVSYSNNFNQEEKRKNGKEKQFPRRIFSGIQPTGVLHLGNYFGAIQSWISLQNNNEDVIFSIVDLHSITIQQKHDNLKDNIFLMTASLLACGIDPNKSILFQQSKNVYHTQLAWVLTCLCTVNRLNHMPTYIEKCAEIKQSPAGLFLYPVLQTADILLYKATHIPAGLDQLHNINLANHLTQIFNNKYKEKIFPIPELIIMNKNSGKIQSLKDPNKKMSKSDSDVNSKILITDTPDIIVKKCKKALTDFISEVTYDPQNRPGVSNLITLHSLCTNQTPEEICKQVENMNTGQYKLHVADILIQKFQPIQNQIEKLMNSKEYLDEILNQGAERATSIGSQTWKQVCDKVGF